LDRQGYELVGSGDSREAWDLLRAEPFDLLMQDLMRPDLDGWELYRMLKSDPDLHNLPVMIVTAVARHIGQGSGALGIAEVDAYVTKPFEPQELLAAVEYVLRKRGKVPPVKAKSIFQMGQLEVQQDVESLIDELQDEDRETRSSAMQMLGSIKDRRAVEPLIEVLESEDSRDVLLAVQALGCIGDPRAVGPLIEVLGNEIEETSTSQNGDRRAKTSLVRALFGLLKFVFAAVLAWAGYRRALDSLTAAAQYEVQGLTWIVIHSLVQIGASAVEPLSERFHSARHAVERRVVVEVLGQIRDERAVETLIAALQDEHAAVRCTAAGYLGNMEDVYTVEPLITVLHDEDVSTRCAAVRSLALLKNGRAVKSLVAMLQDEDAYIVWKVADALGQIGDPCAVPHLERVAKEDTRTTRYGGAVARIAQCAVEWIKATQ